MSSEHGKPRSGAVMTTSKPQKQKREPCPSGVPHHWVIGAERDVEGYFPAECRGCGGTRRFSGAVDPDYMGAYANYATLQARFVQRGRRGGAEIGGNHDNR